MIGPTSADCREVLIEGESGLLNVFPPEQRPIYQPSLRRITFQNGAIATYYSAEEPERLRGPQHQSCWLDEIAVYPEPQLLWDNLQFGLRLGTHPRVIATTTPKPQKFLRNLAAAPGTIITRGSTFDNSANLPPVVLDRFRQVYGGTRIGRQELQGEMLEEAEGALWNRQRIEELRVRSAPELARIVVAIDPAVTSGPSSDETGIVVCGHGVDGHGYVLADWTCRLPPDQWAARAVQAFDKWNADRVIVEVNQGGDMCENVLRTVRKLLPIKQIHASKGKTTRAEPISALYEQGRVHHVGGFDALEDEQCNFTIPLSGPSPNRVDAVVWAFSELLIKPEVQALFF